MKNPLHIPANTKLGVYENGIPIPRIYHKNAVGKKGARYLIKCGDCENSIEVYYEGNELEIGGVEATKATWKKILLPLLNSK